MKLSLLLLLFLCISTVPSFAQKENNNWYFGDKAGLSFNTEPPTALGDGLLNSDEGCASISDKFSGELFFYTDGSTVWNRKHQVMKNGTGLHGFTSSTQRALIVPNPANPLEYYIFTPSSYTMSTRLEYSIVSLVDPDGDVISKNNVLFDHVSEKLTGALDESRSGYWILVHHPSNNTFYSFHVTASGLDNNPVVSTYQGASVNNAIGYLRISPNGKKIALASYISRALSLFDFDNSTGAVSNPESLEKDALTFYGIAFSQDNSKLYALGAQGLDNATLLQFDVSLPDINAIKNSRSIIADHISDGAVALAPDGRIYLNNYNVATLSVINNPNGSAAQCDFQKSSVSLTSKCTFGLPNYMDSYQDNSNYAVICPGGSIQIGVQPVDNYTYSWSPAIGLDDPTIANPNAAPLQTTLYTLTITDPSGAKEYRRYMVQVYRVKAKALPVPPICPGSSVQLSASGGETYVWSPTKGLDTATKANPIATPKTTTRYKVVVTDRGCVDSAYVDVVVKPPIDVIAGPDKTICTTGSVIIGGTAKVNETYLWTPAEGLSDISVSNPVASPKKTMDYILKVTTDDCTAYDTVTVTVNNITVGVSKDITLCMGKSTRLWASGGSAYSWSPTDSMDNPASPNPIVSPIATTRYKVIISEGECIDSGYVTVKVIPSVKANAGEDKIINCAGESIQIGAPAEAKTTYLWSPAKGLDDVKKADPIAKPLVTTKYRLIVSNGNCPDTAFVTVKVNQNSNAKAGVDKTVCPGSSTKIGGPPQQGNTYSWAPATDLDDASTSNPVCALKSGTRQYILTVVNSNGCISYDTVMVTVGNIVAKSSSDTAVCNGSAIQLSASGGSEYEWFPTEGLDDPKIPNPVAAPNKTTRYKVRVSSGTCVDSAFTQITVLPSPIANAGADKFFCNGGILQLGELPQAGYTYSWQPTAGLDDPTKSNPNLTPELTSQYVLTVTNTTGCSSTDTVLISVGNITAHVTGDTSVCLGSSVQLSASGGNTYEWSPVEGLDNPNIPTPLCTPQSPIRYKVLVSSGDCRDSAFVTVGIAPFKKADAGKDTTICQGTSVRLSASGGNNYKWLPTTGLDNPNSANPLCTPISTTRYTVIVSSGSCVDTAFVIVSVTPSPVADAGDDKTICSGEQTKLGVPGIAGNTYSWEPQTGLSTPNSSQTDANPPKSTEYILTVANSAGCMKQDTVLVSVRTPNEQAFTLSPALIVIQPGESFQTILHVPIGVYSWNVDIKYDNLVVKFDEVLQTTNNIIVVEQKGKASLSLNGTGDNGDVILKFDAFVPQNYDTTFEMKLTATTTQTELCEAVNAQGNVLQLNDYCAKKIRMVSSTGTHYFLTPREKGILFGLGLSGKVRIELYDYLGAIRETLVDNTLESGNYSIDYNVPPGVYFIRINAGMYEEVKKVVSYGD